MQSMAEPVFPASLIFRPELAIMNDRNTHERTAHPMTFLNPLVLLGLIAVAIPIILHLLNLRKLRTVDFSTLAFLKELQKSQMRKLKLRQILLLLLRTLAIAAIVLAFARPALRGGAAGVGTHTKTTAVLLLDDSFSMSVNDERGTLFSQMKAAAANLLSVFKEGDEVFLQKFSEGNLADGDQTPTHDFGSVKSAIEESNIRTTFHTVGELLTRAGKVLIPSTNLAKEVYVLSDLQKAPFESYKERDPTQQRSDSLEKVLGNQTRVFILPIGRNSPENASVDAITLKNQIFEENRPFALEARIRNYREAPLRNYTVSLYLDGKRVMQKSIDVPSAGASNVEFTAVPKRAGYISGFVEIEPDAVTYDDRRYFTIFIPEKIEILFVAENKRDVSFLNLALTADKESRSSFGIETAPLSQLLVTPLARFDVIVLSNLSSLTSSQVERLKQYAAGGGGIMFFPGNLTEVEQYNSTFCRSLGLTPFSGRVGDVSERKAFLTFGRIDLEHPLFTGIFEEKSLLGKKAQRSIESPEVYVALNQRPAVNGRSVIALSNGNSFLTEYNVGSGKILLYSVSATLDWSDFPLKGIFVPLIRRSVTYLASWSEQPTEYLAGTAVDLMLPPKLFSSGGTSSIIHKSPNDDEEVIQPSGPETNRADRRYKIRKTTTPGVHQIYQGDKIVSEFSVNVDARESDPRRMTPDEAKKWFVDHGVREEMVKILPREENIETAVLQSRFGVELWRYFLGIALLAAFLEMIVSRERKEERGEQKVPQ
jgi:hypothetical protein